MRHIHRFKRVDIGQPNVVVDKDKNRKVIERKEVWVMKCIKPGCTHYTRMKSKLSCPMLREQIAECNRCGEQFILNRRALKMELPCCDDCVKRKTPKLNEAEKFFAELEEEIAK